MRILGKERNYLLAMAILLFGIMVSRGQEPSSTGETSPDVEYKAHKADIGIGTGLDYSGLLGLKFAYIPIPNLSVFFSLGMQMVGPSGNLGITVHLLPESNRHTFRPNLKIMYGVNGSSKVFGTERYSALFVGITSGIGFEFMFGKRKASGFDIDINVPFHHADFYDQIDRMKADPMVSDVKEPMPIAFSVGFHYEI